MRWSNALKDLRNVLADLYPRKEDCFRIVEEAGIPPKHVPSLEEKGINRWHGILSEAQYRGKVQIIIEIALKEYQDNRKLVAAKQAYLEEVKHYSSENGGTEIAEPIPYTDDYTSEGEEICFDRRLEVDTFCKMLNRDDRISERILAFEVDGSKGKSALLRRFEHICELRLKKGRKILYAREEFRDRRLSVYSFLNSLGIKISHNAADQFRLHLGSLYKLLAGTTESVDTWSSHGRMRTSKDEFQNVARNLISCLEELAREFMVVLMLDDFHYLEETGNWFLDECLPDCRRIENVILILAGREGLSRLKEQKGEVIFRDTLKPMEDWDECQRWAQLHGLWIAKETAEYIKENYKGDYQKIKKVFVSWRDYPYGRDVLIPPDLPIQVSNGVA